MSGPFPLASATTLLGLLQRGRGLGLQMALGGAKTPAREHLEECLRRDPRWDRQLEHRALYYAAVARAVGLTPADLRPILGEVRSVEARSALVPPPLVAGVLRILDPTGFVDDSELHGDDASPEVEEPREVFLGDDRPAAVARADTSLSTNRLLEIVEDRNWRKAAHVLEDRKHANDASLLLRVVQTGTDLQRAVALRGLAALQDGRALEEGIALCRSTERPAARTAAFHYLEALPPAQTLPRARELVHEAFPLRLAGERVLERHAEPDDVPLLVGLLEQAMREEEVHRGCFAVAALGRLEDSRARAALRVFYETTPYAYGRARAARALASIETDFAQSTAVECLYDCESSTRTLGATHADRSMPAVRTRLAALCDDPDEEDEVRAAARFRPPD